MNILLGFAPYIASRSARNLCSKRCALPWRINMTFHTNVNKHKLINLYLLCKTPIHRRRTRYF